MDALENALLFCKANPLSAEAHYNYGTILGQFGRHEEEIFHYRKAISLKPNFLFAHINLGVALRDLRRFDDALRQFKKVLSIDPDNASARTNRAQTNLLLGQFEHGWREYEWRWKDGWQRLEFPTDTLWLGENKISGKRLFVHHEQGYGDTLQFIRFLEPIKKELGAEIILRVQNSLFPLLKHYPYADTVIDELAEIPDFDQHIPLLSLPFALKEKAEISGHPYLRVQPPLCRKWQKYSSKSKNNAPTIGIIWSGRKTHLNDHNRSIPLDQLRPLFTLNAQFVSLQNEIRETDRSDYVSLSNALAITDVSEQLHDFSDTAALIMNLDIIVSVDTAVAHLAAALGKPTWILLPSTPDWRWQLDRADSPWYDTVKLFRQDTPGDWTGTISALKHHIENWSESRTG